MDNIGSRSSRKSRSSRSSRKSRSSKLGDIHIHALLKFHFLDTEHGKRTTKLNKYDITIEMKQLLIELNQGSFASFHQLKELAPELFKSTRFIDFLHFNIVDPGIAAQIRALI